MTIKELAKLAGVSTATVSRALNNGTDIKPDTKRKIMKLVEDLNYQPNIFAKGLNSQKTYTIGVLVPDITNVFFPEVLRGVEEIATSFNYTTVFFNTDYDADKERRALAFLKSGRVDGLIVYVSNRTIDECVSLAKMNYPLVMMGQLIDEVKCPKIGCNNFSSEYTATDYLIKAGHKSIAYIAGHKETQTGNQRLQGYKHALNTHGILINENWITETDYVEHSAYEKTLDLLKREKGITAIVAANDALVAGCYKAIYELGLSIPDDISIVGHDDTEVATLLYPRLTTMRQEIQKSGRLAAQKLFLSIENGKVTEDVIILPTKLIERESVKKLK